MYNASVTINQLANVDKNGSGKLRAMIGAKNFIQNADAAYVQFQYMAGAKNKANRVRITLNHNDLYDVQFYTVCKASENVKSTHHDVFCSDLKELFEAETALYLSL